MSKKYEDIIIGLETHIQITNLKTKLFCSCNSDYRGARPNTHTCPICLGLPGSLPVVNKRAIEFATRLALALGCDINESFWFFRKNYFYPDMSKNYQISQFHKAGGSAFADGGKITIKLDGKKKDLKLNRIHLEEDPARLVHKGSIATSPFTLVDYNRSGVTLIEIVSDPVMKSPEEAREYLRQLKSIVQYTGISDLDLEGSCRVDANISIKGHARSEVKNINSFKEVERALKWEIQRQKNLLKRGKELIQETRHWDDKRRITIGLRTKEFEKDYRYFPEQDLPPFEIDKKFIKEIKDKLPEMPKARSIRFQKEYGLSEFDAEILVIDKDIADFYEEGVKSQKSFQLDDYKQFCNWLKGDISRWLNFNKKHIRETKLKPKQVIDLINFIKQGKITGKIAKSYINEMMKGTSISEIMKKTGKKRIADEEKIISIVRDVIKENKSIVEDLKKNPKALEALIGKCMQKTRGQLDPEKTREIILRIIKK
ncbi:MAG: Asp-tRNA(Asn)/Glu-tRNA(Gln) amidotransferase subunit GatB [Candidatus Hodarchaeota archaeon]